MVTRIITAVVALALLIPLLIFGGEWAAGAVFALICGFSVYEMLGCCDLLKKYALSLPSILISVLITLLPLISFDAAQVAVILGVPVILVCFMIAAVVCHKSVDSERLMMFFALAVYISAGFTALSAMRSQFGLWVVWFVLAVAWATDTFAYFSGMLLGKKKLCPNISPKKTVAGAVGGTIFGTIAGVLVFAIAHGAPLWGLVALPLSIISQFGDLAASVIKRRFGVKDYGKIFPGHGGVLDRFDSIIPVSIITAAIFFIIKYCGGTIIG
ncbi:MAG: phosphatidate cytidylyltransferase [Clostridia bacterium]|nr:phosphatidate cytidylyltransferase [Clostridia bacterium]MBQ9847536.1 phosphatidate cytidylyltransferase [Clostridia bacterium]